MNSCSELDLKYLILLFDRILGYFSLPWSELCVFQNILHGTYKRNFPGSWLTKKAKETSLYNPVSDKILEKRHQDLKTRFEGRTDFYD